MKEELMTIQDISSIIIVDDVPANLKILGNILKLEGYRVRPVPNGMMALRVAEMEKPDLILLDIMMPDMDGFEVCRRLKGNPKLSDIPVIFISALNDTNDIVQALKSGGVDFITKPFQAEEVIVRVKTHLELYRQSKKLEKQSKELQELIATKDKFFSIIAHDLRGPLGGFMQLSELMADEFDDLTLEEQKEMTIELSHSSRNIFNLLENLLEWSRMQQGQTAFQPQSIDLPEMVSECIKPLTDTIRNKNILLETDIPGCRSVSADRNMIQSVIRNLVSNAVKFTPRGGSVRISAGFAENDALVFVVRDTGMGMNQVMVSNLFQVNVNTRRPGTEGEQSTGLGLLLCKEFVEKHGGELWAESEEGKGSAFYFTIPENKLPEDFAGEHKLKSTDDATANFMNPRILIVEDN
ncbi:MAG TPA: hybrid sensor histidine kinase/response regulator [Prolixibacteraceae bacterium]|nr:hybrid sensor histidine kinase/response regulator [Prolixibacteraceae bacterium]